MNVKIGFLKNYSEISQIDEVLDLIDNTETNLAKLDLKNLRVFNKTYKLINLGVRGKLGRHFFDNDEWIEKLDVEFVKFYLRSLTDYLTGKKPAKSWGFAFDVMRKSGKPQFIYLLLGANAHINNDLPLATAKIFNEEREKDFNLVDKILEEKLGLIIQELKEDSKIFGLLKRIFRPVYQDFVLNMMVGWRREAWKNAELIKNSRNKDAVIRRIESDALKKAKEIALLSL